MGAPILFSLPRDTDSRAGEPHYLERLFGPVVGTAMLWRVLNYPTPDALRKAIERGRAPVATFVIPGRRGRFAHTRDVIAWLERPPESGSQADVSSDEEEGPMT